MYIMAPIIWAPRGLTPSGRGGESRTKVPTVVKAHARLKQPEDAQKNKKFNLGLLVRGGGVGWEGRGLDKICCMAATRAG